LSVLFSFDATLPFSVLLIMRQCGILFLSLHSSYNLFPKAMTASLTLEDLRQKIGHPWLKSEHVINGDLIRRYAEVVGGNAQWWNRIDQVPPVILATLGFEQVVSALRKLGPLVLHGSSDVETSRLVHTGETLVATLTLISIRERPALDNHAVFVVIQGEYSDYRGESVATSRQLAIVWPRGLGG